LREKKVPNHKVIIHTQLQKEIDSYDAVGPHVAVAQRMAQKGLAVGAGTMIKYIIISGKGKIRERARMLDEVKEGEYDADYYIDNQVIPAVDKIMEVIGFSKEDILTTKGQSKLGKFI
jgi:DNA polymerase I